MIAEKGPRVMCLTNTVAANFGCSAKSGTCIAVCGMELLRETA